MSLKLFPQSNVGTLEELRMTLSYEGDYVVEAVMWHFFQALSIGFILLGENRMLDLYARVPGFHRQYLSLLAADIQLLGISHQLIKF